MSKTKKLTAYEALQAENPNIDKRKLDLCKMKNIKGIVVSYRYPKAKPNFIDSKLMQYFRYAIGNWVMDEISLEKDNFIIFVEGNTRYGKAFFPATKTGYNAKESLKS